MSSQARQCGKPCHKGRAVFCHQCFVLSRPHTENHAAFVRYLKATQLIPVSPTQLLRTATSGCPLKHRIRSRRCHEPRWHGTSEWRCGEGNQSCVGRGFIPKLLMEMGVWEDSALRFNPPHPMPGTCLLCGSACFPKAVCSCPAQVH